MAFSVNEDGWIGWSGLSEEGSARVIRAHRGPTMRFKNREEAARLLAERLSAYRGQNPLVLGIPRGAVPMACIIAEVLEGEADVILVRKLRAPFQPELAIGAIDEAGTVYRHDIGVDIPADELAEEIENQLQVLRQRRVLYTGTRGPRQATGRTTIIVDDGIATGSSAVAAIRAVRRQKPGRLIIATAVAPPDSLRRVAAEVDDAVCLHSPEEFFAVGQFFDDFSTVTDERVVEVLARSRRAPA